MESDPLVSLRRLAATQHGVVTVAQASALGVSRGRLRTAVRTGNWAAPRRGILVAAAAPSTWRQHAAVAALSVDGALSHRAAAHVHGLDGFAVADIELSVEQPRQPRGTWRVHRAASLSGVDVTVVDGLPVTSIARTLVDLGAVVDDDTVEQALDDALRRGVSQRWIESTLERLDRPGPSGTAGLRRVLAREDRRGPLPDSRFERLLERAVRRAGLPPPRRQVRVLDAQGTLVAKVDAGWPDHLVAVEAHSERWHWGPRRGRSDQRRDNRLAALGWELLYAGWWDVQHPDEFTRALAETLARREPSPGGRPAAG